MSATREEIYKAIDTLIEAIKTTEGKQIMEERNVKFELVNDSEEWRDISNYEGIYRVSNFGRVISKQFGNEWRLRKLIVNKDGYNIVTLSKNGKTKNFLVHRLVAMTFIPNPNNLPLVEHNDDNRLNNNVNNLSWSTNDDNMKHAVERKRMSYGENRYNTALTEADVKYIKLNYKPHDKNFSGKALAQKFNVSQKTISSIINNITWKYIELQ